MSCNNINSKPSWRISHFPEAFSQYHTRYRYEDYHSTPEEIIKNNFTRDEIKIILGDVNFFMLNKAPMQNVCNNLNVKYSLTDKWNSEENEPLDRKMSEKQWKFRSWHSKTELSNDQVQSDESIFNHDRRSNTTRDIWDKHSKTIKLEKPMSSMKCHQNTVNNLFTRKTWNHSLRKSATNLPMSSNHSNINNIHKNLFTNKGPIFSSEIYDKKYEDFHMRKECYNSERLYWINKKKYLFQQMKNKYQMKFRKNKEDVYTIQDITAKVERIYTGK